MPVSPFPFILKPVFFQVLASPIVKNKDINTLCLFFEQRSMRRSAFGTGVKFPSIPILSEDLIKRAMIAT